MEPNKVNFLLLTSNLRILLKGLLPLLIAFSVFISSAGLLIQAHFCQNELQSISLFVKPGSCHKDVSHHCNAAAKKCCKKKQAEEKDNCCHDKTDFVKLESDQYYFNFYFKDKKVDFVKLSKYHYLQRFPFTQNKRLKFFKYKPPLIEYDLQSFFQVFLC